MEIIEPLVLDIKKKGKKKQEKYEDTYRTNTLLYKDCDINLKKYPHVKIFKRSILNIKKETMKNIKMQVERVEVGQYAIKKRHLTKLMRDRDREPEPP